MSTEHGSSGKTSSARARARTVLARAGRILLVSVGAASLAACGTVTGVPSHGGGKRFAIEQELIAASARTALGAIDLRPLAGRTVRIVYSSIGDEGSGNLAGGRLTLDRLLRGDYSAGATTRTESEGNVSKQSVTGLSGLGGIGLLNDGPTGYRSEAFINPRDADFLTSLVASHLLLSGAQIKSNPAEPADLLVVVLVDVFGTIRDRTDYLFYNQERLRARTALEVVVVRQIDGVVTLPPQRGAAEAEWEEDYILWTGPTNSSRSVRVLKDLLVPPLPAQERAAGPLPDNVLSPPPPRPAVEKPKPEISPDAELPRPITKPDTRPRTNPPFR